MHSSRCFTLLLFSSIALSCIAIVKLSMTQFDGPVTHCHTSVICCGRQVTYHCLLTTYCHCQATTHDFQVINYGITFSWDTAKKKPAVWHHKIASPAAFISSSMLVEHQFLLCPQSCEGHSDRYDALTFSCIDSSCGVSADVCRQCSLKERCTL